MQTALRRTGNAVASWKTACPRSRAVLFRAVPCRSVLFRAVGSSRTSHEGQQRGHTSQGVPTQRCWGSRESQGLFPAPVPGVSGDPPASFPFRGGSAAPERIKLRKTTEVTAPSLHPQTCPLCRDWPCPLSPHPVLRVPSCLPQGHTVLRGLCGGAAPAEGGTDIVRAAAAVDNGSCRAGGWTWGDPH